MIPAERKALWELMLEKRVTMGTTPAFKSPDAPWFSRILLGFSAWIGAGFLLGFIVLALEYVLRSGVASCVIGFGIAATAVILGRLKITNDFIAQLSLACSITGQVLFVYGLHERFRIGEITLLAIIVAMQAVLVYLLKDPIHRTVSTIVASICTVLILGRYQLLHLGSSLLLLGTTLLWANELNWVHRGKLLRPVGYGLALAAMLTKGALLAPHLFGAQGLGLGYRSLSTWSWLSLSLDAVTLVVMVTLLLRRERVALTEPASLLALAGCGIALLATWKIPGLLVGLALLLLGRGNGNRFLYAMGIIALLSNLSYYYYALQATLLFKSGILVILGMAMLITRGLLQTLAKQENSDA